jgi:predicted acyl esterase
MPDGISLATTVYFPQDGRGPWPTLLTRTPYGRIIEPDFVETSEELAENGIVVVFQDQRGRYDSEGEDNSFFTDRIDGQATIEWIIAQTWSNGVVATEGGSAMGIVQYMLAPGAPQGLTCQRIEVAAPDLYMNIVYQNGVYRNELVTGWLEEVGSSHLIEEYKGHSLNDEYWDPVQIVEDYDDVHVPAIHVGGYYDVFARGIIDGFLGYQNQGGEGAAGRQHLVMGGWGHGPEPEVGELIFPNALHEAVFGEWIDLWFQACLFESIDISEMDALPTVSYFTMGAVGEDDAPGNEWHTAETWPPRGSEETRIYLLPDSSLGLDPPDGNGGGDTFTYDPNDPSPTICGANLMIDFGSCDQRPVEQRDDVIVYTSPRPFDGRLSRWALDVGSR